MTKYLNPAFESDEWKIRPENGNETVNNKCHEPSVVAENFRQTDLPLVENAKTRNDQCEINQSIEWIALFHRATLHEPAQAEPLGRGSRPDE